MMIEPFAVTPFLTVPGINGATPTTGRMPFDLRERMIGYRHSISSTGGFETCEIDILGSPDEFIVLVEHLGAGVTVWDAEGYQVWQGRMVRVTGAFGQESRTIDLESIANSVQVQYTTVLGTEAITAASDSSDSQQRYGFKQTIIGIGTSDSSTASTVRAQYLNRYAFPRASVASTVQSGNQSESRIVLGFVGEYATLGWEYTDNADTSTEDSITQVQGLLFTTNGFVSNSTRYFFATSGTTIPRLSQRGTTHLDRINALLRLGRSSNSTRLAWGVFEDRYFWCTQVGLLAGSPSPTYARDVGTGVLYYANSGGVVPPYQVRPDSTLIINDVYDATTVSAGVDFGNRMYVDRVTVDAGPDGVSVTLEPEAYSGLDATLARYQ